MGAAEVLFDFEGGQVRAREGDTVASALIAHGVHVFGRSWKYHRPRGYRCGQGHCSACSMRVDGLPGVRTCVTPVRPGMRVEREHALPTADLDVLQAADLLSPLMPPGFYYKRFRRSPRAWGLVERAVARASGQGSMPSPAANLGFAAARCERRIGTDVLVVGGGVAGLSAALGAAEAGARVLLVEQDDRLGGRALDDRPSAAAAEALAARVLAHEGVEVLTHAPAVGWYDEGIVAIDRQPDLLLVSPAAVVLATGAYDLGLPFADWDLPGVMLAAGAERLLHRHGVRPGSRAAVVTTNDRGYAVARELAAAGIEIACLADTRPREAVRDESLEAVEPTKAPVLHSAIATRAHGFRRVSALSLRLAGRRAALTCKCDLVVISAGVRPADDLAYQALADGSIVLSTDAGSGAGERLWLAGLVAGAAEGGLAVEQGQRAGQRAARFAKEGQSRPVA